ncbi:lysophospholipid acyltransferase family protein [Treponema sp.]|uniref:lysophospholipid acyltransferase family protein n=1 Tax=Treponema sp. TaxID=166 RepID=UPI00298E07D3|nr:lysophospholipid acyltransferase family protein [Treponema sp.]MCQ2241362.1 1-acyl-sn-glycerol-3-phosphate acyltransferase [Treponema sp.]
MAAEKLSKEEFDEKYNWRDLPKVSNWIAYTYRAFMKLFWIFFIGTGAVILAVIVFPVLKIFVHPADKFRCTAQRFISAGFRFFMLLLRISRVADLITDSRKEFFNLHSKIVVANHPSILDTVVLIALIPNATVIAAEKYSKGVLGGVIKACYIINSLDFDELCRRCKESLDLGSNVIIFPEGTRTPRHGQNHFKKGAARIARATGANIIPVLIAGSDKFGLGKNNPFWSFNTVEKFIYHVIKLEEINISEYAELSDPISAKRITQLCAEKIRTAADEYKKDHPLTRTVNNV